MTADKIKKYVLPNLPYVLLFWFFTKCGELYRLAPGTEPMKKLSACFSGLNGIFSQPLPIFEPFDILVGVIGAGAVFGFVLYKKKHAKKWRKDVVC